MQMSIGLDRLKRFVCLLLIFVLLFCFFMCPRASAVAVEATTVAYAGLLVGTLLVGAGVAFSNPGDMAKAGNAMYRTLQKGNEAIASKIAAISVWAVDHGKSIGSAALRIGKDLYQGIVDAFNSICSNGVITVPGAPDGAVSFISNDKLTDYIVNSNLQPPFYFYYTDLDSDGNSVVFLYYVHFILTADGLVAQVSCEPKDSEMKLVTYNWSYRSAPVSYLLSFGPSGFRNGLSVNVLLQNGTYSGWENITSDLPLARDDRPVAVSASVGISVSGDLSYPSEDYLVKMPDIPSVDTGTGEVTYPDSIAYTKDAVSAPYPIGDDGVKVPDIPFDIPVDQTSGKPMDDTGTDTDNPSKPGEGTDTDKPSVNWPSAGDISLPKLIISKFPFCIPFDVARLIGLLEADPKTPIFHVPLKVGTILNEEIVLDLSQWDNAVRIIRWGELIVFVAGLVLVTRNYIKW